MTIDQQLAALVRDAKAFCDRMEASHASFSAFGQQIADAESQIVRARQRLVADALAVLASPRPE